MKETLCYRFEEAIENESELDEALRRHAGACPACRALLHIVELHTSPIPAETSEPLVNAINEQTAALAQQYAARHNRKRRLMPFLIGLIGWLSAVPSFILASLSGGTSGAVAFAMPAAPAAPMAGSISLTPILIVSAVWIATVLLLTRGRRAAVYSNGMD